MPGVAAGSLGHSTDNCGLRIVDCGLTAVDRIRNPKSAILARLIPMIALARKYRPKQFADLIVQTHVAAALRGAVAAGPRPRRSLLSRPRAVGRTTRGRRRATARDSPPGAAPGAGRARRG